MFQTQMGEVVVIVVVTTLKPRSPANQSSTKNVRSLELKGKPHFADFNLVSEGWGAYMAPWITAASTTYPWL